MGLPASLCLGIVMVAFLASVHPKELHKSCKELCDKFRTNNNNSAYTLKCGDHKYDEPCKEKCHSDCREICSEKTGYDPRGPTYQCPENPKKNKPNDDGMSTKDQIIIILFTIGVVLFMIGFVGWCAWTCCKNCWTGNHRANIRLILNPEADA